MAGAEGTVEGVRRANLSRVLRLVHEEGPLSRASLTEETGLNRSTIGALVGELAAAGLVAWTVAAERADAGSGHGLALSTFAAALLVQLAGSGWAPPVGGPLADWLAWSDLPWQPTPDHALLLAGTGAVADALTSDSFSITDLSSEFGITPRALLDKMVAVGLID